jgi:GNAT superfamily N-acetyltransferase
VIADRALPPSPAAGVMEDLAALASQLRSSPDVPTDAGPLAEWLYGGWYLNLRAPDVLQGPPIAEEIDIVAALEAAHAASVRFEDGWLADRVSTTGRVEGINGNRRRVLGPGQYVVVGRGGASAEPGDGLRVPGSLASVEHGFWVARTWSFVEHPEAALTRVYVNARLRGCGAAVALLTAALEEARTPYGLKVNLQLRQAQRADAVVLYLPRDRFGSVRQQLAGVAAALSAAGHLVPATPRLTAWLHAGIAAADGQAGGESFGQERCAIIASALVGVSGERATADAIATRSFTAMREAGLDPSRPWLAAGADHDYAPLA